MNFILLFAKRFQSGHQLTSYANSDKMKKAKTILLIFANTQLLFWQRTYKFQEEL